jgi:hypothetical protein
VIALTIWQQLRGRLPGMGSTQSEGKPCIQLCTLHAAQLRMDSRDVK